MCFLISKGWGVALRDVLCERGHQNKKFENHWNKQTNISPTGEDSPLKTWYSTISNTYSQHFLNIA